jgi:hypothetical protein
MNFFRLLSAGLFFLGLGIALNGASNYPDAIPLGLVLMFIGGVLFGISFISRTSTKTEHQPATWELRYILWRGAANSTEGNIYVPCGDFDGCAPALARVKLGLERSNAATTNNLRIYFAEAVSSDGAHVTLEDNRPNL